MFHLVNKYGNVHKKVESERKRDELIAAGYRLAEEPVEVAADVEESAEVAADVEEPVEVAADVEEPVEVAADVEESAEAAADVEEPAEADADEKPKKGKAKKNDTKE